MALVDCPKHLRDLIGTPLIEAIKEIPKADPIVLEYQAAMLRREKRQKAREELLNAENLPKGRVEQLFAILNT